MVTSLPLSRVTTPLQLSLRKVKAPDADEVLMFPRDAKKKVVSSITRSKFAALSNHAFFRRLALGAGEAANFTSDHPSSESSLCTAVFLPALVLRFTIAFWSISTSAGTCRCRQLQYSAAHANHKKQKLTHNKSCRYGNFFGVCIVHSTKCNTSKPINVFQRTTRQAVGSGTEDSHAVN